MLFEEMAYGDVVIEEPVRNATVAERYEENLSMAILLQIYVETLYQGMKGLAEGSTLKT